MRVIGICRFSYPALGGFKRMHDSVADRETYLYAPERMALRFRHFECLTLPSIRAQTDPEFTFLVMIGENMPDPWLGRLFDLTADIPQIRIVTRPPERHRSAMQAAIKEELGQDTVDSIQWRLDDDDAVGIDFVASLRRIYRQTKRLREPWRNMAIEFSAGFTADLSADGILTEQLHAPFWACGLAVTFRPGDPKTVMNYGHHKLHHSMPMLTQPKPLMYIRSKHADNDSAAKYKTGLLEPLTDEQRQIFKDRFNVDEAQVRAVFSAPVVPHDTA